MGVTNIRYIHTCTYIYSTSPRGFSVKYTTYKHTVTCDHCGKLNYYAECASESLESQEVEAKETETTAQEATDLAENAQIQENPNIQSTMHVVTGKEPISLGQDPQDEQNTLSMEIEAAITAPQMKAMTAPQIKVMTVPQIVMMNATCNT